VRICGLFFSCLHLLWARLAERGSKRVLLAGGSLSLLAPLLAMDLPSGAFGLVFLLQGAYLAALGLATTTYLLNLAPPEERSASIGLANSISSRASSPSPRSSGGTSPTGWAFLPSSSWPPSSMP
jgi:Hypothetical protein